MPVIEHSVHDKVRINSDTPYGCKDRDISEAYHAPDRRAGTTGYQPTFWFERVRIPHVMSRSCRYDLSLQDARCGGCKHRGSGEKYNQMVRSKGA